MTDKFDTLAAAKGLTQSGFTAGQAELLVGHFARLENNMATKEDIRNIKGSMATRKDVHVLWGVIFGAVLPLQLVILGAILVK